MGDTAVLYSQLLRLAHDSPGAIDRVEVGAGHVAVAVLRDGSRLRARYVTERSVADLEQLLSRAGVALVRQ